MQLYLDRSPWRRWLKLNGVIRVGSSFDRTNVHIRSGASLCTHGGETTYRHSKKKTIWKSEGEALPETLPAPWTSSLENYEKITVCCLSHPVSGLFYGSLRKPVHSHSALSSSFYCCHMPGSFTWVCCMLHLHPATEKIL